MITFEALSQFSDIDREFPKTCQRMHKIDETLPKVHKYARFVLSDIVSELLCKTISHCSRKYYSHKVITRLTAQTHNLTDSRKDLLNDKLTEQKKIVAQKLQESRKEVIALSIRAGLIALTIVADIGLMIAGVCLGVLTAVVFNIPAGVAVPIALVLGIIGGVAPDIAMFKIDRQTASKGLDFKMLFLSYLTLFPKPGVDVLVCLCGYGILKFIKEPPEQTWVDHLADRIVKRIG